MILTNIPAPIKAGTIPYQLSDDLPIYTNFYVKIEKERKRRKDKVLTEGRYERLQREDKRRDCERDTAYNEP
eukprot:g29003.t1